MALGVRFKLTQPHTHGQPHARAMIITGPMGGSGLSGIRSRPGRTVVAGAAAGGAGRQPAAQQQAVQKPCTAGSAETLSPCAFGVTVVPLCPAEDALSNAQKLLAMHT